MAVELEAIIEQKLIEKLCSGTSQWTYRPDINNEEKLWANLRYIIEQNNKAKLNDVPLSDSEFEQVKNELSHPSFFEAGKWLVGENGIVYVHVQRGSEKLHLVVLNNENIAGGTSVYEVINQYNAFKTTDDDVNRRFDVTLLINGIPMIHIELKNKQHSYIEGFNQIKKYINEGKFTGLFSNIQMFIVSNSVDTKYFAPARANELNKKFITGWLDEENQPVSNYLDFASCVLNIPMAHEIVAKYVVIDNDDRKLNILRPYQIHAIEAMRQASRHAKSGYIWHTTGSGKTMTSYKATRNLLMDIPSLDKTVFLIDRKDLDDQTTQAFQSYANNDRIDVDETDDVDGLINTLRDNNRQVVVTTIQKMQHLIRDRVVPGSKYYDRISHLKMAFVVDECHRAVTPETKRKIESFFSNSLWFGFTGTPIFKENGYGAKGDLPQTTEQLYGECLHAYTIKEAIHDEAVLGFAIETLGPADKDVDADVYDSEEHMRSVLDVILNKSATKLGLNQPKGKAYEAILTVKSIKKAQEYYDLLKKVVAGEDSLKISEEIRRAVPDFPRFAITYSVSENEDDSMLNQDKMKESLDDYNRMFGTHYTIENIKAYNKNLNKRLARKDSKYKDRNEQLDIVIVVDRLLTGFDAPCLSTLFMDRPPMKPQNIIQAFSRTNRLFDANKKYGQIVTFQSPKEFEEEINNALKLYSRGGEGEALAENYDDVKEDFLEALSSIRTLAANPSDCALLSKNKKKKFILAFRALDSNYAHLKSFTCFEPEVLADVNFSDSLYTDYHAWYKNFVEELKPNKPDQGESGEDDPDGSILYDDYELISYKQLKVDFEYIVSLLQGIVNTIGTDDDTDAEFDKKIASIREFIDDYRQVNEKLAAMLDIMVEDIIQDREKYKGEDVAVILNRMRSEAIEKSIEAFAKKWCLPTEDVSYQVYHYKNGQMANENVLKEKADYQAYKEITRKEISKFKYRAMISEDFRTTLMPDILPLLN